ncbi:hypothetical protein BJ138DRAFT_1181376 [Hygrophoropsis aurantiaca]|uniref:Uncharacterized protein n=1 Tax=Hygrophoropsis aurantiaca TaxID=72124 RepID=A0ACB8A6T6_9AGAM|nr:hypothetical protein BJ138DRAFT_1181376 [Hygrophoropsis aurantiaca]
MSFPETAYESPGRCGTNTVELEVIARHKALDAISLAHSKRSNPRNLEYPWYRYYGQMFEHLVADIQEFGPTSQLWLWFDPTNDPDDIDPHMPITDAGDISFSSINTTEVKDKHVVTDFAITHTKTKHRHLPADTGGQWPLSRQMAHAGIPVLCEVKRSANRHPHNFAHTFALMDIAMGQVNIQARYLFRMYPLQQYVVLIAVTGMWWRFRIASRIVTGSATNKEECPEWENREDDHDEDDAMDIDSINDSGEMGDSDSESDDELDLFNITNEDGGDDVILLKNITRNSPSQEQPHQNLDIPFNIEPVRNADELYRPLDEDEWSGFYLIESPASKQALYKLHEYLQNIADNPRNFERG